MKRFDIINQLIHTKQYKSYVEIGVRESSDCFERIKCPHKLSVDPEPRCVVSHKMTSDDFFTQNTERFDIIFIDGLHLDHQVAKDITNALKVLNPNGSIVLHDCYPQTEFAQREVYEVNGMFPAWNGTTWKAFVKFRTTEQSTNYAIHTVDTDHGCAIISPGTSELLTIEDEIEYTNFKNNRYEWLNLISANKFLKLINSGVI